MRIETRVLGHEAQRSDLAAGGGHDSYPDDGVETNHDVGCQDHAARLHDLVLYRVTGDVYGIADDNAVAKFQEVVIPIRAPFRRRYIVQTGEPRNSQPASARTMCATIDHQDVNHC